MTDSKDSIELDAIFGDSIPKSTFQPGEHTFKLVPRGSEAFREKYRPQRLEEVVPTCPIEQLKNQLDNPNASRVFLFEGKSGTGKTTSARIMARAFVCLANNTYDKPCLNCKNCKGFDKSFDVLQLNAADKNKVDDMRSIVEDMKTLPGVFRYKIYILDEVQRLTKDAQQVLLTELEDPASYLLVFLCTTDIKDINKALVDRCCRITFKDLTPRDASAIIDQIATHEGLVIDDDLKDSIFFQAQGSIRALLNNIQAYAEKGFDPLASIEDDAPAEVKALFKLITSGKWEKLSKELKKPHVRKDAEGLRFGLENYARVVLLNTVNVSEAATLGNAIIRLQGSLFEEPNITAMYNAFVVKCLRACCVFA